MHIWRQVRARHLGTLLLLVVRVSKGRVSSTAHGLIAPATGYDCLVDGLTLSTSSNLQNAQVLLGLTPTMLVTLAPSIGEITVLSTRRKLHALLLALGNPTLFIPRMPGFTNPIKGLKATRTVVNDDVPAMMRNRFGKRAAVVSQYLLTLAAPANTIQLSWQLGSRTVVAWKCNSKYLLFLWTLMPVVIQAVIASAWHLSSTMKDIRRRNTQVVEVSGARGFRRWLGHWAIASEFELSSNARPLCTLARRSSTRRQTLDMVNRFASFLVLVHLLFGTCFFFFDVHCHVRCSPRNCSTLCLGRGMQVSRYMGAGRNEKSGADQRKSDWCVKISF